MVNARLTTRSAVIPAIAKAATMAQTARRNTPRHVLQAGLARVSAHRATAQATSTPHATRQQESAFAK